MHFFMLLLLLPLLHCLLTFLSHRHHSFNYFQVVGMNFKGKRELHTICYRRFVCKLKTSKSESLSDSLQFSETKNRVFCLKNCKSP
uniref:Secreted protein n=2 Tax=Caenorhabditis japonica TaxID=281687 RepID=A0A8R1EUK5_CAEJA